MNEEILIKDNHLSEKEMSDLENFLISNKFPYYYNINIAGEDTDNTDTFMFNHILIHREGECSNVGNMITNMVMKNIPHKNIYRSKINFYLKSETLKKHIFHKDDVNDNINVALFYVNTNNHITSDQNKPLAYQGTISKKIIIGSDIWIGARVTILSDVKINDRVVVGAGSLVNKNLESGYLYVGTPAVRKKKLYN